MLLFYTSFRCYVESQWNPIRSMGNYPKLCGLTASTVNGCSKWLQRLQANCKVASDICQFFMCTYCISLLTDNRDRKEDNVMIEFAVYWIAFHYLTYIIY